MQRSTSRILTTHTGSLPRPADLVAMLNAKELGEPYDKGVRGAGEAAPSTRWSASRPTPASTWSATASTASSTGWPMRGRGSTASKRSTARSAFAPRRGTHRVRRRLRGPEDHARGALGHAGRQAHRAAEGAGLRRADQYVGQDELKADLDNLKSALEGAPSRTFRHRDLALEPRALLREPALQSDEEYLAALSEAMRVEYLAIVEAGFVLQIDDPRMATHYNRAVEATSRIAAKFIAVRVEALNHALRGIPADKIRFHTCYSTNIAPRVHDFELKHFVDLMLQVRAAAFVIEAANPRHEHEWQIWEEVKLPDDRLLIPGVVSHCVHLVEHPELVAQRIVRFADVVGRERVIAGTDCGFGTSGRATRSIRTSRGPSSRRLVEGARIASKRLF